MFVMKPYIRMNLKKRGTINYTQKKMLTELMICGKRHPERMICSYNRFRIPGWRWWVAPIDVSIHPFVL